MDRREFLRYAAIAGTLGSLPLASARAPAPEIAFTFDDPTTDGGASLAWQEVNERILSSLDSNKIKSVLFVCGKRVDAPASLTVPVILAHQGNNWSPPGIVPDT